MDNFLESSLKNSVLQYRTFTFTQVETIKMHSTNISVSSTLGRNVCAVH